MMLLEPQFFEPGQTIMKRQTDVEQLTLPINFDVKIGFTYKQVLKAKQKVLISCFKMQDTQRPLQE